MSLVKGPSFPSHRESCLWLHATATLQIQSNIFPFSHLLSSWEKFPIVQLNLAVFLFPWKELGKAETMHSLLMRWDNFGSREISQSATAMFDIGKTRAESVVHWLLTLILAEIGPIPKQLSINLTMLWSTILQLPKCIFTQCSQIFFAEKDLSFNYTTQSTTFVGILPKFI